MTLVFFTCFFGTIQCAIVSLMAERDPSAWKVHSGTELIAVVYAVFYFLSQFLPQLQFLVPLTFPPPSMECFWCLGFVKFG